MAPGTPSNQFLNGRAPQPNVPKQRRLVSEFQQRTGHPPPPDRPGGGNTIDANAPETDDYIHWERKLSPRPDGSTGYA